MKRHDIFLSSRYRHSNKHLKKLTAFIKRRKLLYLCAKGLLSLKRTGLMRTFRKVVSYVRRQLLSHNMKINMGIFYAQQKETSRQEMEDRISCFKIVPLISIIMPVYNVKIRILKKALNSIIAQTYKNWELCAVDDCSTDKAVRSALSKYAQKDTRIKIEFSPKNGGISSASNISLGMAAGEFVALMDNDDTITPDALFRVVQEINEHPMADFIYSDECKMDDSHKEKLFDFFFKPDWSPETLMGFMYTGHFTVYKTELVREVGGFRSRYDTAQDYDLALRVSEKAKCIRHIERILYLWRAIEGSVAKGGKQHSADIGVEVGVDMMKRRGKEVIADLRPYGAHYKAVMQSNPLVSIVIAGNNEANLIPMIHSLIDTTSYTNYEIIVACSIVFSDLQNQFSHLGNILWIQMDSNAVYSAQCNEAAKHAKGDCLVFCQDYLVFNQAEWLNEILGLMEVAPNVGAVSPKVIRRDDTIQYAGMAAGTADLIGIPYNGYSKESYDEYYTRHKWIRDVSVLSATCLAIRRSIFEKINGFDEINTPDKYSNADLSFKVRESGFNCVYNCHSEVINGCDNENDSWFGRTSRNNSQVYMLKKWAHNLVRDPYFTDSMKKTMLGDISYQKIYYKGKGNFSKTKGNIVLFTHELTYTGAPIVLYQAARTLQEEGYFPVIMSLKDGPLREEIVRNGIMVITNNLAGGGFFLAMAKNFDLIICNTTLTHTAVNILNGTNVPVLWWIHEADVDYIDEILKWLPEYVSKNINIYCAGGYAKKVLQKYRKYENVEILLYGIDDMSKCSNHDEPSSGFITFSLLATIQKRKGQDIFCRAIEMMPESLRKKCRFNIIGGNRDDDLLKIIQATKKKFPDEILVVDEVPRSKAIEFNRKSDVIVCSSRDDPMPVFITEGMILGKICICSENTGTASLIKDGKNGFLFRNNDPKELLEKICYVIQNIDNLESVKKESRATYEKYFSLPVFKTNMLSAIEKSMIAD